MPFPVFNLLYSYISTFRSMFAVPIVAVFCSSLTSCFPLTLLRYFVNYFEMLPVAPIITGITFVFTFHTRCISAVRSLYFTIFSAPFFITFVFTFHTRCISAVRSLYFPIFSASFLIAFLSPHIAVSIKPCFFFITTDYDVRFIVKDGSVSFHLPSSLVSTSFGTWLHQCSFSYFIPISFFIFIIIITTIIAKLSTLIYPTPYTAHKFFRVHNRINVFGVGLVVQTHERRTQVIAIYQFAFILWSMTSHILTGLISQLQN